MPYRINPNVSAVSAPPIPEVQAWAGARTANTDLPLLNMAQAVPSYPPAEPLRAQMAELVEQGEPAFYTGVPGLPALREATAAHFSTEYGGDIDTEKIAVTAGCNQAFCLAIAGITEPGDEVILPLPWYFNHQMWLEMHGLRPVPLAFDERSGGLPDADLAATLINHRTRAIVLVTPNNPTGAEYPPALISRFYELAEANGVALIMDETYKDFRDADGPPHDLFTRTGWPDTLVHLYSFSKAYSLTGYRTGTIACGPELMEGIIKLMDCAIICAPHIGQRAALYGIENLSGWRAANRRLMGSRVAHVREAFQTTGLRYELASAGAYFAYVRHPFAGERAIDIARMLATEWGVLALPGSAFGPGQDAYLRFAFANIGDDAIPGLIERLITSQS